MHKLLADLAASAQGQSHISRTQALLDLFEDDGTDQDTQETPASAHELRIAIEEQMAGMPEQQQEELRSAVQAIYTHAQDNDDLELVLSQLTRGLNDLAKDEEELELPRDLRDVAGTQQFSNADLLQMLKAIKMEPLSALS